MQTFDEIDYAHTEVKRLSALAEFMSLLQNFHSTDGVFNPWRDFDSTYDHSAQAPTIRSDQLQQYLGERMESVRILNVGEALGFNGGKFTGIPMMSERILLGHHPDISRESVLASPALRTSNQATAPTSSVQAYGYTEPTATMVWKVIQPYGRQIINWNAFPFHPYTAKGRLTNRPAPRFTDAETAIGTSILRTLLSLVGSHSVIVVAVGNQARNTLTNIGVTPDYCVRHPANGGARAFTAGMQEVLSRM